MEIIPIQWNVPWPSSVAMLWTTLSPDHCVKPSEKLRGRSCSLTCKDDCLNRLISSYVMEYSSRASLLITDSHPNSESSEIPIPNKIGEITDRGRLAWTIEWPMPVCLSLLAVKFSIKVRSRCGTRCCVRSLSRISSKVGYLLISYWLRKCCIWSIWQQVWQNEHSPLQWCFVCYCTICYLWSG